MDPRDFLSRRRDARLDLLDRRGDDLDVQDRHEHADDHREEADVQHQRFARAGSRRRVNARHGARRRGGGSAGHARYSQSAIAKVEAARAKLAATELDLGRTQIRAPIDGIVANKTVAEGQLLSPNQAALAIVTSGDAWVIANFKETQIAEMKVGQCAHIHVDAYPHLKVKGHVESIAPNTGATFSLVPQDTATGNFTKIVQRVPVKIVVDKEALSSGLLRSGQLVGATVSTKPDCE
ncbi:MAG: HlyD family secretion protein [Sphingomonadales bacterium]|nr:MAG: HlyD family secretion protein [Sphingomonadales bacterium]